LKEDEMGDAYVVFVEKFVQKRPLRKPSTDVRIMLKLIFKN
jgi:hypothetical protein